MHEATLAELHEALDPFRRVVDINEPIKPHANQSLRMLLTGGSPTWADLIKLVAAGEKALVEGGHSNAG